MGDARQSVLISRNEACRLRSRDRLNLGSLALAERPLAYRPYLTGRRAFRTDEHDGGPPRVSAPDPVASRRRSEGPELRKFKTRREPKDWCTAHHTGSPIMEFGAEAAKFGRERGAAVTDSAVIKA